MGITHVDSGILRMFHDLGCRSMADIGCGPGGQVDKAIEIGYDALGIDGDPALTYKNPEHYLKHDYELGPLTIDNRDLIWSCEFVEHVKPQFVPNFIETFNCATKYIAMTFASPNSKKAKNHKHFNEQNADYWIDVISDYGWKYSLDLTNEAKKRSTMKREFFRQNGLVFTK